jgi:hypothetical protein
MKRWAMGLFQNPKGWPENSPVWESTFDSCQVVWRCHRHLTPKYRQFVADAAASKRVHHLTRLHQLGRVFSIFAALAWRKPLILQGAVLEIGCSADQGSCLV